MTLSSIRGYNRYRKVVGSQKKRKYATEDTWVKRLAKRAWEATSAMAYRFHKRGCRAE